MPLRGIDLICNNIESSVQRAPDEKHARKRKSEEKSEIKFLFGFRYSLRHRYRYPGTATQNISFHMWERKDRTAVSGARCNCHLLPVTRFLSLQLQSTYVNQPILLRRIFSFQDVRCCISVLNRIIGILRFRRPVSLDSTSMEKLGQLRNPLQAAKAVK
ncbi:hypothetical protein RvY_17189 [Ramazzottius varieornatus]|uniref:Uncharacterized protein n=1 Tax=Ramazzottius varieornatus TaxID=947166 RepID=A0A1D1W8F9_RAMVA|nr:hypothetical protein RvY_17189 [Ramazzottius varieornatus]